MGERKIPSPIALTVAGYNASFVVAARYHISPVRLNIYHLNLL